MDTKQAELHQFHYSPVRLSFWDSSSCIVYKGGFSFCIDLLYYIMYYTELGVFTLLSWLLNKNIFSKLFIILPFLLLMHTTALTITAYCNTRVTTEVLRLFLNLRCVKKQTNLLSYYNLTFVSIDQHRKLSLNYTQFEVVVVTNIIVSTQLTKITFSTWKFYLNQ